MAGLLDLILGGSRAPAAPQPKWGYDADGYLVQGNQAVSPPPAALQARGPITPGDEPNAPPPQAQAPQAPPAQAPQAAPDAPVDNSPINVTGKNPDTWQPHKAGILGQIADYLFDTHFGKENTRRNMEGALEHLTSNPMEAVRRMAKFDPETAQALYQQVMREQHQGALEQHQNDVYTNMAENQAMGVARNMALTANPNNLPAVQQAITNYLRAKGVNQSLIDTIPGVDGTVDDFKMFAQGGIPAAKQVSVNEQHSNHATQHEDRVASLNERAGFHRGELALGRDNLGVRNFTAETGRMNANTAAYRAQIYARQNGGGAVQVAPDGSALVPDKTGQTAVRFMKDGRKALYIRGPDGHHWRFSHQMVGRDEKATGVVSAPEQDIPDEN